MKSANVINDQHAGGALPGVPVLRLCATVAEQSVCKRDKEN